LSLTFFKQAYIINFFAMMLVPAWIVFKQVWEAREAVPARPRLVEQTVESVHSLQSTRLRINNGAKEQTRQSVL